MINEAAFYTTPLFPDSGKRAAPVIDKHSPRAAAAAVPPPPPHTPRATKVCTLCDRELTCFQRPIEESWFCSGCAHANNVFATKFDESTGYDTLTELHCFTCRINCTSQKSFADHCYSKGHRKRAQQQEWRTNRPIAASGHSHHRNQHQAKNPVLCSVQSQLITALQTFDERFRRHLSKEQIASMPLLCMFDHWEAAEAAGCRPAVAACGATQQQRKEGGHDAKHAYQIVHVHPNMASSEFEDMMHQLRTETVFGFDTESAPPAFFPQVARVNNDGPHLVQLATKTHVFLISTTTMRSWKKMEHLRRSQVFRPATRVDSGQSNKDKHVNDSQTIPVAQGFTLSAQEQREAVDAVLSSHEGGASAQTIATESKGNAAPTPPMRLPPDAVNVFQAYSPFVKPRITVRCLPSRVAEVSISGDPAAQRLPQFLADFLHRQDIVLLGFGLETDIHLLHKMMKRRTREIHESTNPNAASFLSHWNAPCVDLSLLFSTDTISSRHSDPASCAGASATTSSSQILSVGTVQAGARVFHARFEKSRNVSVSNWATPSKLLSDRQRIYACRDAVFPLFVAQRLMAMFASRNVSASDETSKSAEHAQQR
ncbi:Hypothetical protein, putative [Bodo saltans]|uniref:Uncharacterized protein n=1 Tax=Bodo saltans TaxID=75058 RepID=A0A0S4KM19_BODSA|nr:Hypothetical protein, putative [Bodo saltans]|eukprot:CUI15421.1 Hypothetical protein, putative [Bodo saltans]